MLRILLAVTVGVLTAGYMAPWGIAYIREHPKSWSIFFLNLLLGWTVIGFLVALIWAFRLPKENKHD